MAYFSNGSEADLFYNECFECLNNEPCPIALVQSEYNYDACNNKTARAILNHLITQDDGKYVGCQMKPIIDGIKKELRDAK